MIGGDLFSVFEKGKTKDRETGKNSSSNNNNNNSSDLHDQNTISKKKSARGDSPGPTKMGKIEKSGQDLKFSGGSLKHETVDSILSDYIDNTNPNLNTGTQKPQDSMEAEFVEREHIICSHELCLPPDQENEERIEPTFPTNPLRTYKFTLDPFQKKSIACIEANESVLISAHTSAGKTVIAEYAIAKALKSGSRVIYTSPIKALSNQKYRDLYEEFTDVGLMTGDTTLNPEASCLVMTTEILRSMLFRGSELMREVSWVIFDEIHYLRDKERGVVWEETIIMLPDKVNYVFLSATIPNAKEFASWIAKIHTQAVHVVYTDFRPTPLQHYIFPSGGEGLYLVVDEKGQFREDNFNRAINILSSKADSAKGPKGKSNRGASQKQQALDTLKIVKMVMEKNFAPVIVFAFSKRDCESMATQLSRVDLTNDEEKQAVEEIFNRAIDSLSEDDKGLPQIVHLLPLLKRGIGIHHSGLLPILKEIVEVLFQDGFIKALFATETFSIGLNMPAKTVVFSNVRKFDGKDTRWVSSGEYIQMSGRAGRRGIDDKGVVILMLDEKIKPVIAKNMVKGQADRLYSAFRISYNSLLNLLRLEDKDPEGILRKSFHQYQTENKYPDALARLEEIKQMLQEIVIDDEEQVELYDTLRKQVEAGQEAVRQIVTRPDNVLAFLQPGRVVRVRERTLDWGWAVVLNFHKRAGNNPATPTGSKGGQLQLKADASGQTLWLVDVLLATDPNSKSPQPAAADEAAPAVRVVAVTLDTVQALSAVRLSALPDLTTREGRTLLWKTVRQAVAKFPDGLPLLDPIEDMKIKDPLLKKSLLKIQTVQSQLASLPFSLAGEGCRTRYEQFSQKQELEEEAKRIQTFLKAKDNVILKDDLKGMKRVLRRLNYTDADDIIQTKGRVTCEINAADELVLTELIFSGLFADLTAETSVALLSCFIFEEKVDKNLKLKDDMKKLFGQVQDTARRVAKVIEECKLEIDVETYVGSFNPGMMDICVQWMNGAKFREITKMTEIFEGNLIRYFKRLEELLRQMIVSAKSIGNSELEIKFEDAMKKMKRDIVFAASLYL